MSETGGKQAINTFSVSKWLTTALHKMSHTQQQVLKWSKNAWKNVTLKIWDKMSHAITASPCSCCLKLCICNITMFVAFLILGPAVYCRFGLDDLCLIEAYCVFVWLWALVCSVFWRHSVGPWENAQTLSCSLPYYPPIPIPTTALQLLWCLFRTCFAMFSNVCCIVTTTLVFFILAIRVDALFVSNWFACW